MTCSAVSKLTVSPELALEFLAAFSRLEYALKVTKFRCTGEGEAKANWTAFSAEIDTLFRPNRHTGLLEAFNYLTDEPPTILAVQNGMLDWYDFNVPASSSPSDKAIRIIKQVRHNLFHGGKFAQDPKASKDRDTKLLTFALRVLNELQSLIPDVHSAYEY